MKKILINGLLFFLLFIPSVAFTDDWIQFRSDASRSGYTENELPSSLGIRWVIKANATTPAWVGVHTIIAGGLVIVPEGQARCNCSYQMLPSIVLAPRYTLSPNERNRLE